MKAKALTFVRIFVFTVLLVAGLWYATEVFKPEAISRQSWKGYLKEDSGNVDVLFAGTSHVYSAINPDVVDSSGGDAFHSYVLSGSGQSMALTYYTIKEALRTQHPKVVALEAFRIIGKQKMAENNAMANFHYMPVSLNKVEALFATTEATSRERIGMSLVTYHSRWQELKRSDFKIKRVETTKSGETVTTTKDNVQAELRGYSEVENTETVEPLPETVESINQTAWQENYPWLLRIAQLCKDNDCKLVLFWTPNAMKGQQTYIAEVRQQLSADYPGVTYIDYNSLTKTGAVKYDRDFADQTHVNVNGARIVSADMGKRLAALMGEK